MAYSVAYQHTDGYRNHDGSDIVYGVKVWNRGLVPVPQAARINKCFKLLTGFSK